MDYPRGIRPMRGRLQIRYTVDGKRYEETLDISPTRSGVAEAARIRKERISGRKYGAAVISMPFETLAQEYLDKADIELSTRNAYRDSLNIYWAALAGRVMDADPQAFGSNSAANALLVPQITAKFRFDSGKARNLQFFATDDWKGFWTGEREAAKVVRSLIGSQKLVMQIYGIAGENPVFQIDLPADAALVHQVMTACGQKLEGKDYL